MSYWIFERAYNRAAAMANVNTQRRKRFTAIHLRRKTDPAHGTSAAYQAGCGCDACVAANTDTTRKYRERQKYGT